MHRMLMALLLAALSGCGESDKPAPASAAPKEVKADCDTPAKTWFNATYGDDAKRPADARPAKSTFSTHYNPKLKLCLTRLERQIAASGKSPAIDSVTLYEGDPKAKKSRGAVFRVGDKTTHCVLDGKQCKSAAEWEALVKPLLQN